MAENQEPTPKVEETKAPPADPPVEEGTLDFAKLDELIAKEDSEFAEKLNQMATEGATDVHIDMIDLDKVLAEEQAKSFFSRLKRLWKKFMTFMMIFMRRFQLLLKLIFLEGPKGLGKILGKITGAIGEGLSVFGEWPFLKKIAALGVIAGAVGTGIYIYKAATQDLFPVRTDLFVLNLEEVADDVQSYSPEDEMEYFYDSTRASQNMMILPKMVTNLRKSPNSGTNPMGAFEFFVEGNSPEVMIEIKDREYEVRDLFLRTIEEFNFDQLDRNDGKQLLLEKLRREVNGILTKGKVRKVFFKTAIIKP
jgi:flagellar basal body-associated protein FliL